METEPGLGQGGHSQRPIQRAQVLAGSARGVKGYEEDGLGRGSRQAEDGAQKVKQGPGAWEAGGLDDQHQASQHEALPAPGGRREDGVQPVAHAPCWAETRKVPLRTQSPSAQKATPPAGLVASLHSGLRSRRLTPARRGVRSWEAPGAHGTRTSASPGLPLGGIAARCALFHSAGTLVTERSTARPGNGREAARSARPKAGPGWPHDPSPSPPADSVAPVLPTPARRPLPSILGGCGRVGLGPGAGLGADPEAGLSLRQDPAQLPPVSLCLSSSLLLLRAEPGMGGPAPGWPGTVM